MTDTVRALTALQTLYADNSTRAISEQDLRDGFYSALGVIPYVGKTANYTATEDDNVINCDATGGAITITLPAVATTRAGKTYTIRKVDTSANAVIVDGNASETLTLYAADTTQILFTVGANLTIVNTGATWLVTNSYGLVSGHVFLTTASTTVANTASETTVIGSGIGTLTLPANFFRVGKTIHIVVSGVVSTTGTPSLTLKVKLGSTVILTSGAVTTGNNLSNALLNFEAWLTCRTVGGSGSVFGQGYGHISTAPASLAATAAVTVDTTTALAVNATAQWGTGDPANTLTVSNVLVERVS